MGDIEISPLAKRLAEENNVDWHGLTGSGEDGKIVERDVLDYLARVMAGDEDMNPTPEPLPEGMQSWAEQPGGTPSSEPSTFAAEGAEETPAQGAAAADTMWSDSDDQLLELDVDSPEPYRGSGEEQETTHHEAGDDYEVDAGAEIDEDIFVFDDEPGEARPAEAAADTSDSWADDLSGFHETSQQSAEPDFVGDDFFSLRDDDERDGETLDSGWANGSWDEPEPELEVETQPEAEFEPAEAEPPPSAGMESLTEPEPWATELEDEPAREESTGASPDQPQSESDSPGEQGDEPWLTDSHADQEPSERYRQPRDSYQDPVGEENPWDLPSADPLGDPITERTDQFAEPAPQEGAASAAEWNEAAPDGGYATPDEREATLDDVGDALPEGIGLEESETRVTGSPATGSPATGNPTAPESQGPVSQPPAFPLPASQSHGSQAPEAQALASESPASESPASPSATSPLSHPRTAGGISRGGIVLRRDVDLSALMQAQQAVALELGLPNDFSPAAFLLRAAARAGRPWPLSGEGQALSLASLGDEGVSLVQLTNAQDMPFRDLVKACQAPPPGSSEEVGVLAVADLSTLGIDEAVLDLGSPVLTLGRITGDGGVRFRGTLALSGPVAPDAGSRFLGRVSDLLAAPVRLVL